MTLILVLLTFAFLVTLELIKASRQSTVAVPRPLKLRKPSVPSIIERYLHPGHAWALVHDTSTVTIGVDDFSQRLLGRVDSVELPVRGALLHQGDLILTLHHGKKSLMHVAPLSGVVLNVNEALKDRPALVNESPYEGGWVAKISPTNLRTELHNLLKGVNAERWQEAVRTQLIQWFSPRVGTVLQDGGNFIEGLSDRVTDEDWEKLVQDFYPIVSATQFNLKSMT